MEERTHSHKQYFPALTGVRALAAYLVFFQHYSVTEALWPGLAHQFNIGVTMFFVLSGFLIAYRYSDIASWNKEYFISRFARIYPLYFVMTSLTFVFLGSKDFLLYLSNITFFRGLSDQQMFTGVAQGWSLTPEVMFYFTAPLILLFARKNIYYLLGVSVALVLLGMLLVYTWGSANADGFMVSNKFMFRYTFFGRNIEFLMGVSMAILYKKNYNFSFSNHFTYLGLIAIIGSMFVLHKLHDAYESPFLLSALWFKNILLPFSISLLFWGLLHHSTRLSRFLACDPMQWLGKSSYVFYLIHFGIIAQLLAVHVVLLFIIINVLALLIYRFVEVPLNVYVKRIMSL